MIAGGLVTVFVSDMDRAVKFYSEVLGLPLQHRFGDHWASVDAGRGTAIGLHPPSADVAPPGTVGAITVGLNVDQPLDEVVALLRGRGVGFRGEIHDDPRGGIRTIFFEDPDGNRLYLVQSRWEV